MEGKVQIINTPIVNPTTDDFWAPVDRFTKNNIPKPVMVITNTPQNDEYGNGQLSKMLDACKIGGQCTILRLSDREQAAWHQLKQALQPGFVFLIGVLPQQLGISAMFRLHEPNNFDGCIWLPSIAISELEKFPDTKKALWMNGMKPVFIDKQFGDIALHNSQGPTS